MFWLSHPRKDCANRVLWWTMVWWTKRWNIRKYAKRQTFALLETRMSNQIRRVLRKTLQTRSLGASLFLAVVSKLGKSAGTMSVGLQSLRGSAMKPWRRCTGFLSMTLPPMTSTCIELERLRSMSQSYRDFKSLCRSSRNDYLMCHDSLERQAASQYALLSWISSIVEPAVQLSRIWSCFKWCRFY